MCVDGSVYGHEAARLSLPVCLNQLSMAGSALQIIETREVINQSVKHIKKNKSETRMTASVLKQDPNT